MNNSTPALNVPADWENIVEEIDDVDAATAWLMFRADMGDTEDDKTSEDFFEDFCGDFENTREFAMEMAADIGAVSDGGVWPFNCIDWNEAADELRHDFYEVRHAGRSFFFWAN